MNDRIDGERVMLMLINAAFVLTAIYYATGVDWSYSIDRGQFAAALTVYFLSLLIACSPYIILRQVVRIERRKTLATIEFFVVMLPAPILFYFWRNSEGWSFFLVPMAQLIGALISLTVTLILDIRLPSKKVSRP